MTDGEQCLALSRIGSPSQKCHPLAAGVDDDCDLGEELPSDAELITDAIVEPFSVGEARDDGLHTFEGDLSQIGRRSPYLPIRPRSTEQDAMERQVYRRAHSPKRTQSDCEACRGPTPNDVRTSPQLPGGRRTRTGTGPGLR